MNWMLAWFSGEGDMEGMLEYLRNRFPDLWADEQPDAPAPTWQLRYASTDKYNEAFAGRREEIRENPFRFWYAHYGAEFSGRDMTRVALLNISGSFVSRAYPV